MNKQELVKAINDNGGATLTSNFKSAAFNSGYMVSLQDYEFQDKHRIIIK